jgi:hypothetical protein
MLRNNLEKRIEIRTQFIGVVLSFLLANSLFSVSCSVIVAESQMYRELGRGRLGDAPSAVLKRLSFSFTFCRFLKDSVDFY